MMNFLNKQFLCGILVGIFFGSFFIFCQKKPKYAYVDVETVITSVSRKLQNEKNIKDAIELHRSFFQMSLDDYSHQYNTIIFSSPKPISGVENITDHFVRIVTDFKGLA